MGGEKEEHEVKKKFRRKTVPVSARFIHTETIGKMGSI
jgi:hypothetical protein